MGIDIEVPDDKVRRISHKFVSESEFEMLGPKTITDFTQIWSAKEAVFKWYGKGEVDFKQHIRLKPNDGDAEIMNCFFVKDERNIDVFMKQFPGLCLSYVITV